MSGRQVLRLLPASLSAVLLAAHFSRAGVPLLVALALAFPLLLLVRRPWARRVVQGILILGALEWVRTAVRLASERAEAAQPWLRLVAILGAVALFTFASALALRPSRARGDGTGAAGS